MAATHPKHVDVGAIKRCHLDVASNVCKVFDKITRLSTDTCHDEIVRELLHTIVDILTANTEVLGASQAMGRMLQAAALRAASSKTSCEEEFDSVNAYQDSLCSHLPFHTSDFTTPTSL